MDRVAEMSGAHTGYYNGCWYGGGTVTTSEMYNREVKAVKLAAALFKIRASAEEVISADSGDWKRIAELATEWSDDPMKPTNPPNEKNPKPTVDAVLAHLARLYADEAAEADDKAEAKWEDRQMDETGADRCPPRE